MWNWKRTLFNFKTYFPIHILVITTPPLPARVCVWPVGVRACICVCMCESARMRCVGACVRVCRRACMYSCVRACALCVLCGCGVCVSACRPCILELDMTSRVWTAYYLLLDLGH